MSLTGLSVLEAFCDSEPQTRTSRNVLDFYSYVGLCWAQLGPGGDDCSNTLLCILDLALATLPGVLQCLSGVPVLDGECWLSNMLLTLSEVHFLLQGGHSPFY